MWWLYLLCFLTGGFIGLTITCCFVVAGRSEEKGAVMGICAGCFRKVPVYGGKILRLSDNPDRILCDECKNEVELSIKDALYHCSVRAVKENIETAIDQPF